MSETKKIKRRGRAGRAIRRWIKRLAILAIVAVAALFGLRAYLRNQAANQETEESYTRTQAVRGAIKETVYGTGTTSARNQTNLLAEADGTLTDLRISVGDTVKAGDILAVLTNEDIDDTITDLEFALWDLDETITDTGAGSKVRSVLATAAGNVMAVYANKGDDALAVFRREGALAIISTDDRMKAELVATDRALGLTLDETVKVVGEGVDEVGTVVNLTQQGTHATITIHNDNLPMGTPVTIFKESGEAIGEATLEPNKPMAVSAFGGTIKDVRVKVGDEVTRRETLFVLEDPPLTLTLEDLRLQREAAAKELEDAKIQRENLIIIAPCDGVVASVNVSEGDEITSGTLIGSILEGEDMNLTIAVDELDVVEVEIGQKVAITIDALSDAQMEGEVYKIAPVGTNSGGVTTYDVELTFDAAGTGVRSGMNATGEIEVASKDDALYVPVEALMTVNNEKYVMVEGGGSTVLADAFTQSQSAQGQRGQRGEGEGMTRSSDMPQMGGERPAGGSMSQMGGERSAAGDAGGVPEGASDGENMLQENKQEGTDAKDVSFFAAVRNKALELYAAGREKLMAWVYEGIDMQDAQQVTGSLVKVEVGLQNDDYAEIVSGLSEGDVVLYTSDDTETTTSMFGGMGGGGMGGGGMGGGGMGGGGMRF